MADRNQIKTALEKALSEAPERSFTESVEIAFNLKEVDLSNPKNRIDVEVNLPHGRGSEARVGLFCSPEMAEKVGGKAALVVRPEQIEDLADDKRNARKTVNGVDYFLAEAPLMPTIGRFLGVVLGPRGKMPNPVPPGSDPSEQIETLKTQVRVRSRDKYTFHALVGKRDQSLEQLVDNADAVVKRVLARLEHGERNIRSIYVKTTMGPSVKLE